MQKDSIHSIIRKAEDNYIHGTTRIGDHVEWSMHDTIERITAYLNSKHISGDKDSLGRDKPFFNITVAARNIWWRATDIDRKDIRFIPKTSSSVVLAFVANVMLQNWMDKNRFGQFLNQWGLTLASYGSAISKWVERDNQLVPSVVPWNRTICDPVDFEALPRIEKLYKTPGQLRNMATEGHPSYAGYDMDMVESLIAAVSATRKTLGDQQVDNQSEFIELWEVHGLLPAALLEDDWQNADDKLWEQFRQQMHVVSYTKSADASKGYDDYTLFKGKEKNDIYQKDDLISEDGRTLAIGSVEASFEAQWMQNHSQKNIKDTLDLASKLIFQTADSFYVGRNVLSAIESGDILVHKTDSPLTQINNSKADITAFQNFASQWRVLQQEITSTPDALRGTTLPSGTPYSLGAYLGGQANSLFEIMTENKGLAIEDMLRKYIIPHLKKQLKNKDEIVGILDDAGVQEIDALYVPAEAVRRFNKRTMSTLLQGGMPSPFNQQAEEQSVRQGLGQLGNKRFFVPDELSQKQWDEVFADFEWDNVRLEVTNESADKQAILQTLASVFQSIVPIALNNPAALDNPILKTVLGGILRETSVISPLQLSTMATQPQPQTPLPTGGGGEALQGLANTA